MTAIKCYCVLPEGGAETLTAWAAFAHTLELWQHAPRLVFTSKEPECGKTTALSVMTQLVPRPLPTVSITPAVLYRIIERAQPTLLIDEADTFMEENDALRGILNSGHSRDMAFSWRCHPETNEPEAFSTWAPIAIAKIGGLHPTLASRSLILPMRRKLDTERVAKFLPSQHGRFVELHRRLRRWALDSAAELAEHDTIMPPKLGSRAEDNWRPLITIADVIGGDFSQLVGAAAQRSATLRSEGVSASDAAYGAVVEGHKRSGKAVPEYVVRERLSRLVPRSEVNKIVDDLLKQGRIKIAGQNTQPGSRTFAPGDE